MSARKKKNSFAAHVKLIVKFAFGAAFAGIFIFFLRQYLNSSYLPSEEEVSAFPSSEYLEENAVCLNCSEPVNSESNTNLIDEESSETIAEEQPTEEQNEAYKNSPAANLFYQKLAELEISKEVETQKNIDEIEDITEKLPDETLAKIYEEELPTDVIVEEAEETPVSPELLAAGYHVFTTHKDVKSLKIIPSYKPVYFGKEPVIAVVIDDMGISQKRTGDIISLRAPLTASFLTYGRALDTQVENAKEAGLEIMVHTPMEPHSKADLAPDTLTTKMGVGEIKSGLEVMLNKFHNVQGINNHMGSKLTEDFERMNAVMEVLKERDLFFLDSKTTAFSVAKKAARQHGVSYATRHVFLDNENRADYILKQLAIAERIARRNGYAIAIGHPKTGTYQALKEWLPTLEEKKIKLVPLSEIVKVLRQSHV